MTRVGLASSMMASAGYNSVTRILEIEFATGAVYVYFDVPPDVYRDLLDAPSQGRFFHKRIRGIFECHPITDDVSAQ